MENQKEKEGQWWRWLVFIPVGLVILFAGTAIGKLLAIGNARFGANFTGSFGFIGLIAYYVSNVIVEAATSFIAVIASGCISPKENVGATIFASLLILLTGASLVLKIIGGYVQGDWYYYVVSAASIIATIAAMITVNESK